MVGDQVERRRRIRYIEEAGTALIELQPSKTSYAVATSSGA